MSGHRTSRRRDYGRRQKEVKGRHAEALAVVLDAPELWVRGRGWEHPSDGSAGVRTMGRTANGTGR